MRLLLKIPLYAETGYDWVIRYTPPEVSALDSGVEEPSPGSPPGTPAMSTFLFQGATEGVGTVEFVLERPTAGPPARILNVTVSVTPAKSSPTP